ncbi:MAG: hypothetical protein Q7S17_03170 [Xanthobacteraceae bacterium]|nr:hypothetical protein [Xanthobacteraceae bacterium]
MPEKNFAIIVASLRARNGKTLLARLIADYFLLTGDKPEIFDTDAVERKLAGFFPELSTVIDLDRVPDQMKLFDTLQAALPATQVIDVTHRSFQKFFKLMRDIDYAAEARSRGIEPVIFYIPDRDPESYEQGRLLRERCKDCSFVLVENAFVGEIGKDTRRSTAYAAFKSHYLRMTLPQLDPFFTGVIEDPKLSLSDFMRPAQAERPARMPSAQLSLAHLSREAGDGIRLWLKEVFKNLKWVMDELKLRGESMEIEDASR